jgi:hypothetical protein
MTLAKYCRVWMLHLGLATAGERKTRSIRSVVASSSLLTVEELIWLVVPRNIFDVVDDVDAAASSFLCDRMHPGRCRSAGLRMCGQRSIGSLCRLKSERLVKHRML